MSDQETTDAAVTLDEKLNFQYMPSNWPSSKHPNLTSEELLDYYIKYSNAGASSVYETYANQITTISYGERKCEEIDIVSPLQTSNNANSLLAYIHGGYWQEGYFREYSMHLAAPIVEGGYHFAAIGYLDTEQLPLADIIEQAVKAVNKLADYACNNNISSVVLSGHSAGAHLIAMVALSSNLNSNARMIVKGIVLLSGVYNIIPLLKTHVNIPKLHLQDTVNARLLSPAHKLASEPSSYVLENSTEALIGYGECESQAFKSESQDFHKLLTHQGISCQMSVYDSKDHFSLIIEASHHNDPLMQDMLAMLGRMK